MKVFYFTKPPRQSGGSPPLLFAIAAQPVKTATVEVSLMLEVGMSHSEKTMETLSSPFVVLPAVPNTNRAVLCYS
jgi:hypothetical protein